MITQYYEDPAKSFVAGFGLLQGYVLSYIFITINVKKIAFGNKEHTTDKKMKPSKYSPFTETHFCNLFTQSRKAD